jgi:hypothetical protein
MRTHTFTLYHRPRYHARQAVCHVSVYQHRHGAVVVMTEPRDNPGVSVTNAVESIATTVAIARRLDPATTVWVEHYPDRHPPGMEHDATFDESYDLVTFTWDNCPPSPAGPGYDGWKNPVARNPVWRRLHPEVAFGLTVGWLSAEDLKA